VAINSAGKHAMSIAKAADDVAAGANNAVAVSPGKAGAAANMAAKSSEEL